MAITILHAPADEPLLRSLLRTALYGMAIGIGWGIAVFSFLLILTLIKWVKC